MKSQVCSMCEHLHGIYSLVVAVDWLACLTPKLVLPRDGSAQTIVHAATLRQKLQIKLAVSPSHSILTPGRPVPALTLQRQVPGRVVTGVPIFKSGMTPPGKNIHGDSWSRTHACRFRGCRPTTILTGLPLTRGSS